MGFELAMRLKGADAGAFLLQQMELLEAEKAAQLQPPLVRPTPPPAPAPTPAPAEAVEEKAAEKEEEKKGGGWRHAPVQYAPADSAEAAPSAQSEISARFGSGSAAPVTGSRCRLCRGVAS